MEKSANYALSSSDLKDIFGGNLKIMTYDKIKDYNNIDDLLGDEEKYVYYIIGNHRQGIGHVYLEEMTIKFIFLIVSEVNQMEKQTWDKYQNN